MKKWFRRIGLCLTALLPGPAKRFVLRHCFGFQIGQRVRIGIAYLDCVDLTIGDLARIAHGTVFWQCGEVTIGRHATIGPFNLFRGGVKIFMHDYSQVIRFNTINSIPDNDCTNDPDSSFYLGYGSIVTSEHRIDFTDKVTIGRHSILGGRNSSIWTHNRRTGIPVNVGNYCYLGSEIRLAPGVSIPDCCIVGLGSVLTASKFNSYTLIAGNPAKERRKLLAKDQELIFAKTRTDLPDEDYPALPTQSSTGSAGQTSL